MAEPAIADSSLGPPPKPPNLMDMISSGEFFSGSKTAAEVSGGEPTATAIATAVSQMVIANVGKHMEQRLNDHRAEVNFMLENQLRTMRSEVSTTLESVAAMSSRNQSDGGGQAAASVQSPPATSMSHAAHSGTLDESGDVSFGKDAWRRVSEAIVSPDEHDDHEAIERLRKEKELHDKKIKQQEHFMQHFSSDELFGISAEASVHPSGRTKDKAPGRTPTSLREALFGDGVEEVELLATLGRVTAYLGPKMLIQPGSVFRQRWDAISVALVIFIAAVLPYRICFALQWSSVYAWLDFFIDVFFLTDIVLNFFTCRFSRDGELLDSFRRIAHHYARSWLLPDLIASIPFDWILLGITFTEPDVDEGTYQLTRGVEAFRLLRLLRVARLYRYLGRYEDMLPVNSNLLRLLNVIIVMAFFAHWNGCFQYLLATFEAEWVYDERHHNRTIVFHEDSWVARLQQDGVLDDDNAWSWSYFNAISQMLAISTGVKAPKRRVELWGYMGSILLGAMLYGFFVASLTTTISEADASAKDYRTKLDMVQQYMKHVRLPREMRAKLMQYFELRFPSRRSFDEQRIMSEISTPMRQEIALHKCHAVLSTLQVLQHGVPGLAGAISQQLERVVYVAGDHIIRAGEESHGMYFVSSGLVEVIGERGDVIKTLGASSFFGEMALLNPEGRSVASVVVKTYCEGYRLSVESYDKIVYSYPSFREYLESAARLRLGKAAGKRTAADGKDGRDSKSGGAPSLEEMFDNLNPMKRKINQACNQAERRKQAGASRPSGATRKSAERISGSVHVSATREPPVLRAKSAHALGAVRRLSGQFSAPAKQLLGRRFSGKPKDIVEPAQV